MQEVEPDGLLFDSKNIKSERIKEDADYEGVRANLLGYLGKARTPLQIDIGFADIVSPAPIMVKYPTILQMPAPYLRGYPPESVVAEKLQALVFLGAVNSRMKDYYDLWVLAEKFEFDGQKLQNAIVNTFRQRKSEIPVEIPIGLRDDFAVENQPQWQAFQQRTQMETGQKSLKNVVQTLNQFLLPPIRTSSIGSGFKAIWKPGGPWKILGVE